MKLFVEFIFDDREHGKHESETGFSQEAGNKNSGLNVISYFSIFLLH